MFLATHSANQTEHYFDFMSIVNVNFPLLTDGHG
ncbi:hypothetical protein SYN65AY6LI_01330 [Synechococcus sp. 65AY6Li]|nr:hypothetical protein SYN65AY6LI_01330 [Synechococcus sp. 65AY6Li]